MEYFKINGVDYSKFVKGLKVSRVNNYNSQTNAAGNTVVDFISSKKVVTVDFIPVNDMYAGLILDCARAFSVTISYRDPESHTLKDINCIVSGGSEIEYYTIQENKVMYKPFTLTFTEL